MTFLWMSLREAIGEEKLTGLTMKVSAKVELQLTLPFARDTLQNKVALKIFVKGICEPDCDSLSFCVYSRIFHFLG